MQSYYLITASNASLNLHPQNSLVTFKNALPQELDVRDFKVALQSISLDTKYGNIPNSILGTRNHLLLFLQTPESSSVPDATYDITDFTMGPQTFVATANRALSSKIEGRSRLSVSGKTVQIALNKCVLLVHPEVNKCLNFRGGVPCIYNGRRYTALNSEAGARIFKAQNDFPRSIIAPRIIKVQLAEMSQNLSDVKLVQDLAIIRVKPQRTYPFYNVCKRKEYFKLRNSRLGEISIRLVDENNWPLHLGSGQPTFLKLQLKKFPMKSFVLRLSSLESRDVFAENKASSFRIILQQQLDCDRWDVALSSIYLPSKTNVGRLLTKENFYIDVLVVGVAEKRIVLHDLNDFTAEGFVKYATAQLATAYPNRTQPFNLILEEGVLYLESKQDFTINISGMLAYLLAKAASPTEPKFWPLEGQQDLKKSLGKLNFDKLHPHAILIYCNFIRPLVVGNTFGRVLQMIPYFNSAEENSDGLLKYEAQHLDFIPLAMNDRAMLQFEMRNSIGDVVSFPDETAEILLTLVFREKM